MNNVIPQIHPTGHYTLTESGRLLGVSKMTIYRMTRGYVDFKGEFREPVLKMHWNKLIKRTFILGIDLINTYNQKR